MMLLLFTLISVAPNLSEDDRKDYNDRLWIEYLRLEYEEQVALFVDHLGYKESRNNWMIANSINCIGEWQFAYRTLKFLGYGHITPNKFKTDPSIFPRELQLVVLKELIKVNELQLQPYVEYIGLTIKGTVITKAGLLAGCHLGGIGSVGKYLTSFGVIDKKDVYGTKISDYIKEFGLYNL